VDSVVGKLQPVRSTQPHEALRIRRDVASRISSIDGFASRSIGKPRRFIMPGVNSIRMANLLSRTVSCAIDARMKQMQRFFRYRRDGVSKRMGRIHYALRAAAAKDIRRI